MTTIYDTIISANMESLNLQTLKGRAWVNANVDGTSNLSYNVSSLTDVGTGRIGVNFSITYTDTNYPYMVTVREATSTYVINAQHPSNLSTTRSDFQCNQGATPFDPTVWNILVFGNVT